VVVVAGLLLWRYLSSYESTDDAQADVHIYPVSARISGYVIGVSVNDNQWVNKGDVLVEIDPTDYQVALAQAQANLANAEATARSLNITVPITSVKHREPAAVHCFRDRGCTRCRQRSRKATCRRS
jgi:membrane fusion protein (multidrug efflux system)